MTRTTAALIVCAALALRSMDAQAARCWTVRDGGTIGFTAAWEGTEFDGEFHRFTANIQFDPADLDASSFDVQVDVTSADTRSSDRDEGLADAEWFDYAHYPQATFVSTAFRALDGAQYEATGTLTIKGVSREIKLPFSWEQKDEATARLHGETKIVRTDFRIGEGEWAEGDVVGLDVRVKIDLALNAKPDGD